MAMGVFRQLAATLALALAAPLHGQDGERGSVPPGESRDGAAPAAGAIKGGSIAPGETSGIPDNRKLDSRCDELSGTLREDCLKREREAGGGATKPPADIVAPSDTRKRSPERAD